MNPNVAKFLAIFIPLFLASILFVAFKLVYVAGKSMAEARSIDPVSVGIIILILVLIAVGIRYYPPWIGRVAIDSFREVWGLKPEIEEIIMEVINDSSESWNTSGDNAPVVTISQPTSQPSAPMPTPSINFDATATAFFGDFPTALPAGPTATPTWSNQDFVDFATTMATKYPTPKPTIFICVYTQDVLAGCQPPTPVPGE